MALERLIICDCSHTIDIHGDVGCANARCECALRPHEVIESVIASEVSERRERWLGLPQSAHAD